MKLVTGITNIFTCLATFTVIADNSKNAFAKHPPAVSSSAGSEKFYLEMKRLHSTRELKYDNQENTQAICEAVLHSAFFFHHYQVKPISHDDELVHSQLKQNFSKIHADLYPNSFLNFFRSNTNPYAEKTVSHLGEDLREYVFSCVAKERRSETLKVFFVSYKYDFGCMAKNEINGSEDLTGRFVFEYNEKKEQINLVALVENPARVFILSQPPTSDKRGRPEWCDQLTPAEKLRMCSVVLNGESFAGIINFLAREDDVETQCKNDSLIFYGDNKRIEMRESVFKCRAEHVQPGRGRPKAIFYISAGDENRKYFLSCREGHHEKVLRKYFYSYNLGTLY